MKGNRTNDDMIQARAEFVQEVVARGRAAERPPVGHADDVKVYEYVITITAHTDYFPFVCV